MGCGCGKSAEQRMAERLERRERFKADREASAVKKAQRLEAIRARQHQPKVPSGNAPGA